MFEERREARDRNACPKTNFFPRDNHTVYVQDREVGPYATPSAQATYHLQVAF